MVVPKERHVVEDIKVRDVDQVVRGIVLEQNNIKLTERC